MWRDGRDRIVVSTSRCGRDNPGSNPGHGRDAVDLWCGIATFIFLLQLLYPPSERRETGVCSVFNFVYLRVCVCAHSVPL